MNTMQDPNGDVLMEWWLDETALPDVIWARLQMNTKGTAEIFDADGQTHPFQSIADARRWLNQEEYLPYADYAAAHDNAVPEPPVSFLSKEALLPIMKKARS